MSYTLYDTREKTTAMNSFFNAQFDNCPFIGCFIVIKWSYEVIIIKSSYENLLVKDNSVSIHHKRIQALAIECLEYNTSYVQKWQVTF